MKELGIGKIITEKQARDAIHVPVMPVTLPPNEYWSPGQWVSFLNGKLVKTKTDAIGIIDPFLKENWLREGTQVWIFLFPGSITSLRHDWSHPVVEEALKTSTHKESEAWVRGFLKDKFMYGEHLDGKPDYEGYNEVIYEDFIEQVRRGEPFVFNSDYHGEEDALLRFHLENILGERLGKDVYFGCSC